MAAPGGRYFIQGKLPRAAPHHGSFAKLWETKWRKPAEMGVYPFMFGAVMDFEPIVEAMIKKGMKEPYDWDEYASMFLPKAAELAKTAVDAERNGETEKASEYYLRSSAVYRIARFPAPRSSKQRLAWEEGKKVCLKGLSLREHPIQEVLVAHTHALPNEGTHIPIYYLLPAQSSHPAPCVVIFTGLDGYRTELAVWAEGWRRLWVATIIVEIPGTGDSPADLADPKSPDRQWSSLLDWVDAQERIDSERVVVWAFSTGGFYAIRAAHTHADRLHGVVALGGGCHHMFDKDWLDVVNHLEYPFDLADTLAQKFGYGSDVSRFKAEALARFSLLRDGTLDGPRCARLLLVNGTEDEIFPIDDYYLALQHGPPKEARFVKGVKHMGEPESFFVILKWIYERLGLEDADVKEQMGTLRFEAKY